MNHTHGPVDLMINLREGSQTSFPGADTYDGYPLSPRNGQLDEGRAALRGGIRLLGEEGWWIAEDVETGVTTQGNSREAALTNLDEAVALYDGGVGRPPTDDELRELGIDK